MVFFCNMPQATSGMPDFSTGHFYTRQNFSAAQVQVRLKCCPFRNQPSKIARAIKIGRSTRRIVWQNIGLAFGVKIIFMILGAIGMATLWEAVFADVGVALLAILNAVRLQRMSW